MHTNPDDYTLISRDSLSFTLSSLFFSPSGRPCIISHLLPASIDYADLVFSPQEMPVTHNLSSKCLTAKARLTHSSYVQVLLRTQENRANINNAILDIHFEVFSKIVTLIHHLSSSTDTKIITVVLHII